MTPGGVGLALQRSQLAADLAQEILHAQQAGLGGIEAALGLLLAAAVLQHAGGLFDDRPAVLRTSIEHGVDLALRHDDVLLAADTGVAQQLLHVEQAAVDAVDRVLALAGAEQRAADRDLVELDRQQLGRVVECEHDLGAAERRALRGTGEDDVVHLLRTDGAGCLRAEDPRDRVHHVRFARSVRPDHHRHAGLELHHGGVRERLETLESQCLEKHNGANPSGRAADNPASPPTPGEVGGKDHQIQNRSRNFLTFI